MRSRQIMNHPASAYGFVPQVVTSKARAPKTTMIPWYQDTPLFGKEPHLDYLVSVITPAHNEDHYLRRVTETVARQTIRVLEHIIIDDGSSDDSLAIFLELLVEFPHLTVILRTHGGAARARNAGIAVAQGRYIAFLDADDFWFPHKLQNQISHMETKGHVFTYGDYLEVDDHDTQLIRRYRTPKRTTYQILLRGCPIGCLTVAYNQEKIGKQYMPTVYSGHDWGLWLHITSLGHIARKYPGLEAVYTNGRSSLSSKKIKKVFQIYRIYRTTRNFSRVKALYYTLEHSITALAKKCRLIY